MPPNWLSSSVTSQSTPSRLRATEPGQPHPHVPTNCSPSNATPLLKPGEWPQSHGECVSQVPSYHFCEPEEPSASHTMFFEPHRCGLSSFGASHARSATHVWPSSHEMVVRPTIPCATNTGTLPGWTPPPAPPDCDPDP